MEKTEPTFVPEWLKNNGSLTTSHQSDDQGVSKSIRNKSLDNDLGRPTTSSYFRHSASSNGGSHLRPYSSFGRNRDRDKEKFENRHRDYTHSDPLANILPSRFEKDGLRRSHSNLSVKRGESWPRKVVGEKNGHNNGKISFERDFPSLGVEDKQGDFEIGRVPSPGLSSAIQSLPIGNSGGVIGGDVWTSALAEVPVMVNGSNVYVQQPVQPNSISGSTTSVSTSRNMAETLAQGPPRAQTAPRLSVGTQRLEELAVKQSRQLIPMTPSMPKALALNSTDKLKVKAGQLHFQSSHTPSPRPVVVKSDISKTSSTLSSSSSTVGKLHILKPSRERNGTIAPTPKENSSPTGGSKLPNSPLAVTSAVGSAPLRNTERKVCEKRPSPQAKSRNDFFNLMRKKSMANNSSSLDTDSSDSTNDKTGEGGTQAPVVGVDTSCGVQSFGENKVDLSCNGGDACVLTERSTTNSNNGNSLSSCDVILYSEEEEARFLRSLGWEETTEEEGLTEEEINSFYRDVSKYVNLKTQPKSLMPLNLQMGKNGDISPDTKVDS